MARRRTDDSEVSLFPFLSILVCLIGVLTLLIVGVSLGQMNPEQIESMLRGSELEAVKNKLTEEEKRKAELEALIKEAERIRKALTDARTQLAQLQNLKDEKLEGMKNLEAQSIKLLAQIKDLDDKIKALEAALDELLKQIEELQKKLLEIQKPPPPAEVKIIPSGTGKGLTPTFVECNSAGIVIYQDGKEIPVPSGALAGNADFQRLCEQVAANDKTRIITFLVRPDGIDSYGRASDLANRRWAPNGKLPAPGQGKLDLSLFNR